MGREGVRNLRSGWPVYAPRPPQTSLPFRECDHQSSEIRPGGTSENSPAFQGWVNVSPGSSPEGTTELIGTGQISLTPNFSWVADNRTARLRPLTPSGVACLSLTTDLTPFSFCFSAARHVQKRSRCHHLSSGDARRQKIGHQPRRRKTKRMILGAAVAINRPPLAGSQAFRGTVTGARPGARLDWSSREDGLLSSVQIVLAGDSPPSTISAFAGYYLLRRNCFSARNIVRRIDTKTARRPC